ncbi:2,3-diaminopropionate biosynthesis protein SbnA [Solihabitans fulvus]|uniref:2,3-diaminopropionate biosynthesis protein SbnA n=1 Tax=Solihabitans fulvus TaxID=1892852 RepID=UPI001CB75F5B|nr:2,3-diaminopropionate biosynthesis protein SbnA [Solihabitans fulvus]
MTGEIFLELPGFAPHFDTHLKLEGLNPAGSIKLKTAVALVDSLEQRDLIGPGSALIESTSGNLGIALATVCATRKYPITLVTDPNANARSIQLMRALGAEVVVVRDRDRNGGFLQTRIDYVRQRVATSRNVVWLNQYANPANTAVHRDRTAQEILDGFGAPDWLFVGAGTTGTLMGCVERFRDESASTTIVAVDSVGSVSFGGPPSRRWIPGLGTSRRPEIFRDDGTFQKLLVPEADTIRTCRRVGRDYGLLLGGSSGTVLAAVTAWRDRIPAGSRVLAISPDLGDRYLDTIYHDEWVSQRFGADLLDSTETASLGTGLINHV